MRLKINSDSCSFQLNTTTKNLTDSDITLFATLASVNTTLASQASEGQIQSTIHILIYHLCHILAAVKYYSQEISRVWPGTIGQSNVCQHNTSHSLLALLIALLLEGKERSASVFELVVNFHLGFNSDSSITCSHGYVPVWKQKKEDSNQTAFLRPLRFFPSLLLPRPT